MRQLALLGVNVNVEDLLDKLAKALTFRLTLDMNFQFKDWDSEGTVGTQVNEEANGKVERLSCDRPSLHPHHVSYSDCLRRLG